MGLFDVLPNFLFATSAFISTKHGIYELSHELPNGLRLGILQQCDKWVKNKKSDNFNGDILRLEKLEETNWPFPQPLIRLKEIHESVHFVGKVVGGRQQL